MTVPVPGACGIVFFTCYQLKTTTMKMITKNILYRVSFLVMALLSTLYTMAQDNSQSQSEAVTQTSSSTTTPTVTYWYAAPWVWIVGAAIFILLLVAILQSGRRSA